MRDGEQHSVCTSLNECLKAEDDGLEDAQQAVGTHGQPPEKLQEEKFTHDVISSP